MGKKKRAAAVETQAEAEANTGRGGKRINKSAEIRKYLKIHPDAMPQAAAEKLSKKLGVEVKPGTVSAVKYQLGREEESPTEPRAERQERAASSERLSLADLLAAKQMAQRLGVVQQARQMLDALAKLQE